jgi:hypothetical protein
MTGRNAKTVLRSLTVIAVLASSGSLSHGQVGSSLGSVTFSTPCAADSGGSSVGVGITFDGTNLWYSCYDSKFTGSDDLYKANPITGAVIAGYMINGGLGAIAYDASRNVIWAGEGGGNSSGVGVVIQIPLDASKNASSGTFAVAFPVHEAYSGPFLPGYGPEDIVDGLAINTASNTLYIHYDFSTEISLYNASTGVFLGKIPESPGIPSGVPVISAPDGTCVLSGLAIGGNTLFEGSDYCDYVWAVDKTTQAEETASSFSIASAVGASFDEKALTCDTSTFHPNDAIWVMGAFSSQAYAFEIPPNSCGIGGQLVPTCTGAGSIQSNFNGTPINGGDYIWFNSNFSIGKVQDGTVIQFTNAAIQFSAGATNYSLTVPNAVITFTSSVNCASTFFDTTTQTWNTTVPLSGSDEIFLSGLAFPVPVAGLPGGINPVTWSGNFSTNTPGLNIQWKWGAAAYTSFTINYNSLGVKPAHTNVCAYNNSDHAGTPENYKSFVTGGARGGGGSNFTGGWSGTAQVQIICH